jgi:Lipopolysaccharide-assembly
MNGRVMTRIAVPALVLALAVAVSGCLYSFTGASVPAHLKTIAIPLVDDQSGFGEPGLREKFTTDLTNLFIGDNSLEVADRKTADAILEGAIVSITDAPSVVEQGEQVRKRRVTVSARFIMKDMKLRRTMWEKTFANWGDYESGGGPSQRQTGLAEALRKVSEDVLLESVSGW